MTYFKQITASTFLECEDLKSLNIEDGYSIVPIINESWSETEHRLLVVVESVDALDLLNQQMLSGSYIDNKPNWKKDGSGRDPNGHNPMRTVFANILDKSLNLLKPYVKSGLVTEEQFIQSTDMSLGFVNFNAKKTRHLDPKQQVPHFAQFTDRIVHVIRKLKPTHVLVCGDTANHWLLQKSTQTEAKYQPSTYDHYRRGWVLPVTFGKRTVTYTSTLDLELLYNPRSSDEDDEDDGSDKYSAGDLLYFVARNIANLFAGRLLHDISQVKPCPVYVGTRAEFNSMLAKLEASDKPVAVDTETRNLSNFKNAIYYCQFALTSKRGYVVPLEHPKSPFSEADRKYIKKRLAEFLENVKYRDRVLIFHTGTFDLRIFRTQLGIKMINWKIHDIPAGEQLLDENLGLFSRGFKTNLSGEFRVASYGGLRAMCMLYGNDHYHLEGKFTKEDRTTTGDYEANTPEVVEYASMDAQVLIALAAEQFKRAANLLVRPSLDKPAESYLPYFTNHLLNQMSNTVQGISYMEESGSPVDLDYLVELMAPKKSPILGIIKDTAASMKELSTVKKANAILLKAAGKTAGGLFGVSTFLWNPAKREHKEALFFNVMKLKSVATTPAGAASLGKVFVKEYKDSYPEVAIFEEWTKAKHMLSAFIKGWHNKIRENLDSVVEACLRPGFGFFTIVTGRLNSFGPSLQQVPSRGKLAKYIKRMFRAPSGYLGLKYDFSAHEIRMWSILSNDHALAQSFIAGLELRRQLIAGPTDEIRKELKTKGDVHIQNAFKFFKKWIEKSDPIRDATKALIFGVCYGKSPRTLAKDLKSQRILELVYKVSNIEKDIQSLDAASTDYLLTKRKLNDQLKTAREDLKEAEERDWEEFANDIIDRLFQEFPDGHKFLTEALELVNKYGQLMSPIGRVRHLWRVFTGRRGVTAAAGRRAQNSPIQGIASEIGCSSAFLIMQTVYDWLKTKDTFFQRLGITNTMDMMPRYCRAVHDCNVFLAKYEMVLPMIHFQAYVATTGVTKFYKDVFNVDFTVIPEIEMEVSVTEDESKKWSWEVPELLNHLYTCLLEQVKLGDLDAEDLDDTWARLIYPWTNKAMRKSLCTEFPILDVDIDDVIVQSLKDFDPAPIQAKFKPEKKAKNAVAA